MRSVTLFALLSVWALSASAQVSVCSVTWSNASGGLWNDGANWDTGTVPTDTDDACITLDGTYTVTNTTGAGIDVNSLTVGASSGTQTLQSSRGIGIAVDSEIGTTGVLQWSRGFLSGGATLTNRGLTILDGSPGALARGVIEAGSEFVNAGTMVWESGVHYLYDEGAMTNAGTLTVSYPGDPESLPVLDEFGTDSALRLFTNTGTIDVQSGTLFVRADSRHDNATLTVAAGATLHLDRGLQTFVGTSSGTATGDLLLSTDAVGEADGAWDFDGAGLQWQRGFVRGGQVLTNSGVVELNGAPGALARGVIEAGSEFVNDGTVVWESGIHYVYDDGAIVNNGTLTVDSATEPVLDEFGSDTGLLLFTNTGTIDVQSGTLSVRADSRHDGATLTVAAGATLHLDRGLQTFAGTTSGTATGDLLLSTDAMGEAGGTWDFDGTGLQWQRGYVRGGQTLTNAGAVVLNGAPGALARGVTGAASEFANAGTVVWESGIHYLDNEGAASNSGAWTIDLEAGETSARFDAFGSDVNGTRRFTNTGAVVVAEGSRFDVNVPFDHQTGGVIGGGGTLDLAGSAFAHLGDTAPGTATEAGTLAWTGEPWAPPAGATLSVAIGGTTVGTDYDQLAVADAATLDGTLDVSIAPSQVLSVGEAFTVLTASSVSGAFDAVTAPPGYQVSVAVGATDVVVTVDAIGVVTTLTGGEGWRMLAPAFPGQMYSDVVGPLWTQGFPDADAENGVSNLYLYNEGVVGDLNQGYQAPGSQLDAFPLGTGAFIFVYSDDDYDGTPEGFPKPLVQSGTPASGPFSFPVDYTDTGSMGDDGWNLLGNPYVGSLDWKDAAWTRTGVTQAVYVYDPVDGYKSHNTITGSLDDGLIAPAQGFWVQATATPTLTAPASAETTGATFYGREASPEVVELQVRDAAGRRATAHVLFADGGAEDFDPFDAVELAPLAGDAVALFTGRLTDGTLLDIQTLAPLTGGVEIPVGVSAWAGGEPAGGEMVLTWPQTLADTRAVLRDRETGAEVDLATNTEYAFTLSASATRSARRPPERPMAPSALVEDASRFALVIGQNAVGTDVMPTWETTLAPPAPNPTSSSAQIGYTLVADGRARLSVYDALGREVAVLVDDHRVAGPHQALLDSERLAPGVYVVRLTTGSEALIRQLTVVR